MKSVTLPQWQLAVQKLAAEKFPEVIAETLNTVAEKAHFASIVNMKHDFVKLNQFSKSSMRFKAARPGPIGKMYARTGTVSLYLDKQDEGGQTDPKGGENVAVPTLAARGGAVQNAILTRFRLTGEAKSRFFLIMLKNGNEGMFYRKAKAKAGMSRLGDMKMNLVMVRAMHVGPVKIVGRKWHELAVKKYGTSAELNAAFKRAFSALNA